MKIDRVVPCQDLSIVRLSDAEVAFMADQPKRLILANNDVITTACK